MKPLAQITDDLVADALDTCLSDPEYLRSVLRRYYSSMPEAEQRERHADMFGADEEPTGWDDLSAAQRERLEAFRDECIARSLDWKAELASLWATGRDAGQFDGHLLRQIRNQRGPAWLAALPY